MCRVRGGVCTSALLYSGDEDGALEVGGEASAKQQQQQQQRQQLYSFPPSEDV